MLAFENVLNARLFKNNVQFKARSNERVAIARQITNQAIEQNSEFVGTFRPKLIRSSLIGRYTAGMNYGRHAHEPFMTDTPRRKLFERNGKTRSFDLASRSNAKLLRIWVDL